ncbi:MAG: hypothetical protein HYU36_04830 [Planctomycetes bacterium]|nr:hypothetical protein [Planctomycetota bacterium]
MSWPHFLHFLIGVAVLFPGYSVLAQAKGAVTGDWTIQTVGEKGNHGQNPKDLSQSFTLKFLSKKEDGKEVTGSPFGFHVVKSSISQASPGGNVSFKTIYDIGGQTFPIKWDGKLSRDGKKMANGKFSFILGSGAFTASKAGGDRD